MDKKTIFGLVLIFAIVFGFSYLNKPSEEELQRIKRQRDSVARVDSLRKIKEADQVAALPEALAEQTVEKQELESNGLFSVNKDAGDLTIQNDKIILTISSLGGRITAAQIRNVKTFAGDSLYLFKGAGNAFGLHFFSVDQPYYTNDLYFEPMNVTATASQEGDVAQVTMRLNSGRGGYIDYIYTLPYGSYQLGISIKFEGMGNVIPANRQYVDLQWKMRSPQQEKNYKDELHHTTIAYQLSNDDFEEFSATKDEYNDKVNTKIDWIAFKEQFFSGILASKAGFDQADLAMVKSNQAGYVREFSAMMMIPMHNPNSYVHELALYVGPNKYHTLESYSAGYDKLINLGWWVVSWINKYIVINVFDFLSQYFVSYGLIIFLLVLIIKLLLFPLTFKSYKSQAKMRILKPKVDEISARYPDKQDAMKKQQAIMALYKSTGTSMFGGCLPMLVQLPVLYALFRFFPSAYELRQKSFLWAHDLSTYDSIAHLPFSIPFYGNHVSLFTLLMAIALFVQSKIMYNMSPTSSNSMPGMKFMSLYLMPVMMLFFFNNYSAALSYYYFLASLITIVQMLIIQRTIDEKALLQKLENNAKKPKKKSRFMERLEKMQKLQEEQARQQRKKRK